MLYLTSQLKIRGLISAGHLGGSCSGSRAAQPPLAGAAAGGQTPSPLYVGAPTLSS